MDRTCFVLTVQAGGGGVMLWGKNFLGLSIAINA